MNKDLLTKLSEFLTPRECFRFSTVSKEWNKGMTYQKSQAVKKSIEKINFIHSCQNICPCLLKALIGEDDIFLFPNRLDHLACVYDNTGSGPDWFINLAPKHD